ncbi:ATPase family gene 2 protein homolog B [Haematobia irritans]|uniref:ATPase family gene 2 protein homolog B n=1 Tax=Haematobia irritans TaxID=7368 RepID=UPI003F507C9B
MPGFLQILPLRTVENFVSQKCLLPKDKCRSILRPGQWAKCWFHPVGQPNKRNFAICQIYPRNTDEDAVCYMDLSVCKFHGNDQLLAFDEITPLNSNGTHLEEVHVSFYLLPNSVQNILSLSIEHLQSMAQILLQEYNLSADCIVSNQELHKRGVGYIEVRVNDDMEDKLNYVVRDATKIHIDNVMLSKSFERNVFDFFDISPFKRARRELDDLMSMAQLQRCSSNPQRMSLNALIVGPVGSGKTSLIEDFLNHYNCNVFRITTTSILKQQYPGEAETELRKLFRSAKHFNTRFKPRDPTVILIEDVHWLCQETKTTNNNSEASITALRILTQILSLIDELNNSTNSILCFATTNSGETLSELARRPGRFDREIPIAALSAEDRNDIIMKLFSLCNSSEIKLPIPSFVAEQTQGYVLSDLALLVRNVEKRILTKPQDSLEVALKESLDKCRPLSVRGAIAVSKTNDKFETIGGMQKLKNILKVSVLAGLKQEQAFRKFGLTLPKGVLLYGPPGCAKTTIAKCLASEANMTFIATSAAEVYSPYIGCAEKFIAKIFDTARKNSPCLIFFDEIDSLVGRRSMNASSGDIQIRILSTLLTEMDGVIGSNTADSLNKSQILVVAATNRPDMVDDALLRPGRFDKLIHVPAPDENSRRSILAIFEKRMPFAKDVDLHEIAARTHNYSGSDICNLCNEAAMNAFQRDFQANEIQYEDFNYILQTSSKSSLTQNQIDWYYQFENKFLR